MKWFGGSCSPNARKSAKRFHPSRRLDWEGGIHTQLQAPNWSLVFFVFPIEGAALALAVRPTRAAAPSHRKERDVHSPSNGLPGDPAEALIRAIERPDPSLLVYYIFKSLMTLVLAPLVFPPLFFKYHTLRYRFDSEGISMKWGLLFRKEINLTYARIQDIHLSRGIIERWLGLATVDIQTASGTAGAEMSIQGIKEFDLLRDFLYARMRGRQLSRQGPSAPPFPEGATTDASRSEALELLRAIHADLSALRSALAAHAGSGQQAQPEESTDV